MIMRACISCGKPSPASYCEAHKPKPWATSTRSHKVTIPRSQETARRDRILKRYLDTCHVCGKREADQVDHVVPLGEGGADDETNLAPIHAVPCHRLKTAAESARSKARSSRGPE